MKTFPCSDSERDPDMWHSDGPALQRQAQKICLNECDERVRAWCLELGMQDRFGVYGGTTPDERATMRSHLAGVA